MHTQEDLSTEHISYYRTSNLVTARAEGRSGREPKLNHQRALSDSSLLLAYRIGSLLPAPAPTSLADPNAGLIRLRPV